MKIPKKRIWILAVLLFVIVVFTVLLLCLNQKAEPVVSAFLTTVYTVEDPAAVSELYEKVELEIQRKMEQGGAQGVVVLEGSEDPLYAHYSLQYGSLCTQDGFEKMIANRVFDQYGKIAVRQNWKLEAGTITLDPHTPNQFGYTIDVAVTNITTGEQKTVPQQGIILVKRTLLGYKIQGIQMQSTDLINPRPEVF